MRRHWLFSLQERIFYAKIYFHLLSFSLNMNGKATRMAKTRITSKGTDIPLQVQRHQIKCGSWTKSEAWLVNRIVILNTFVLSTSLNGKSGAVLDLQFYQLHFCYALLQGWRQEFSDRGADSFDEGARIRLSVYCKCQKSPTK